MKNRVNEFFDSVTPVRSDDEIISDVLRKAENMKKDNTKKFSFRKPMTAACAAVCILGVGVTAAAATGLIDFDAIFSRHIAAENDTVAGKILANVSNVITEVSDENYNAELKAVISDSNTIIGCIGITRKDGTPVIDSLEAPLPDMQNSDIYLDTSEWYGDALGTGYEFVPTDNTTSTALEFVFNEDGNLDVYFDLMKTYSPELGKIVVMFDDILSYDVSANERTTLLPLKVMVQFSYEPSEAALVIRNIAETDQRCLLSDESGNSVSSSVVDGTFSCTAAKLTFSYEYNSPRAILFGTELFKLIRDGEIVGTIYPYRTSFNNVIVSGNSDQQMTYITDIEGTPEVVYNCQYRDLNGNIAAFDISEIDAIQINDTIYPLA